MKVIRFIFIFIVIILFLSACSALDENLSPAPVSGEAEIAQSLSPAPGKTPSDSPSPSADDEWGVFQEDAEGVIADGFYYLPLTGALKGRITGMSFPDGEAETTYDDLRYIRLKYFDFEGKEHEDGELIVNAQLAAEVAEIFYELYKAKYPFASVRLVDDYGEPGDDNLSMAANNTSAFNYRVVTGTDTLSLHSYGAAIDINPVQNPYVDGERVVPEAGIEYLDRSLALPGMIGHDDLCYQLFAESGWRWGGDWEGDKDYQHFSKDVR